MIRFTVPEIIKMNKRQRQELCQHLEREADEKIQEIRQSIPPQPTMNNYLVGKILAGQIEIQSQEYILNMVKSKISAFGRYDKLIYHDWGVDYLKLNVDDIFVIPDEFKDKMSEYDALVKEKEDEIRKIREALKALKLHVMVGSNEALTPIMQQIDQIGLGADLPKLLING